MVNLRSQYHFGIKVDLTVCQPARVAANLLWILSGMERIGCTDSLALGPLRQLAEGWTFLIAHSIEVTVQVSM